MSTRKYEKVILKTNLVEEMIEFVEADRYKSPTEYNIGDVI